MDDYFWNAFAERLDRHHITLTQAELNQTGSHGNPVQMLRRNITIAMHNACMQEMRNIAGAHGWPGPDVPEHAEGYDGPCFCEECRSCG